MDGSVVRSHPFFVQWAGIARSSVQVESPGMPELEVEHGARRAIGHVHPGIEAELTGDAIAKSHAAGDLCARILEQPCAARIGEAQSGKAQQGPVRC